MCGIAGWIDFRRDLRRENAVMEKMSVSLAQRGPDEKGFYSDYNCAFAHRRLVVIDPAGGKQPMSAGSFTICYNGELYNTGELREELEALGTTFSGHSDTEVLLKAYIAWGESCLEKLNGIYAFAVWNSDTRELFLARDRAGVKPLFFSVYENGLVFASEIKALLLHPFVKPKLDAEGVASIMLLGPARKTGSGVFRDVMSLEPAQCAVYGERGLRLKQYWRLKAAPHTETADETAEHLRFLITDSIRRQLVSDVPLCTFLSGGLDSSIISAVAAKKLAEDGEALETWSVDYRGNRENFRASAFQPDEDAPWIIRMSEFIGSRHNNVLIDTPQLADALYDSTLARDLPGMADVDSSLWLFCKSVREKFPVALSGECADELLAGYPWYRADYVPESGVFPWAQSTEQRAGLLRPEILGGISPQDYVRAAAEGTLAQTDYLDSDTDADRRTRRMFMLNFYWFMQTLLDRKDRCSMAHGLEVRVPFCDHRIAEYAYNIPSEIKFFDGREKGIVRKAMAGVLPDDVLWRKKSPYPKTHNPDYMALMLKRFTRLSAEKDFRLAEILDRGKIAELIETEGRSFTKNWYGQLMAAPQLFAYLIQTEFWLRKYDVQII